MIRFFSRCAFLDRELLTLAHEDQERESTAEKQLQDFHAMWDIIARCILCAHIYDKFKIKKHTSHYVGTSILRIILIFRETAKPEFLRGVFLFLNRQYVGFEFFIFAKADFDASKRIELIFASVIIDILFLRLR